MDTKEQQGIELWKAKSIERSKEIKRLKKRIKELAHSRDSWKEKSIANKERADRLENDLSQIKKKLNGITQ
ncbi:hypothetical protein FACS1894180_1150 [Bacteroidia bacterium]|nr:hypothetical protein FACS1894180_1150 [Bacteroidia bacterium]